MPPSSALTQQNKRHVDEDVVVSNKRGNYGGSSGSSNIISPSGGGQKRPAADLHNEDLCLHVGAAYCTGPKGSVSEIYSPPRIAPCVGKQGFAPGWSLDLTTTDEKGRP